MRTTTAVINDAILNRAPVPIATVSPESPADLERIVNKALEKDRDLRCQTATELRADLKRLKRDTDSGRSAAVSADVAGASRSRAEEHGHDALATAGETPALHRRWHLWLAASLAPIVAGLAVAWFFLHRPPPLPSAELTLKRLTFNPSDDPVTSSAISADGKYLAYSDSAGIHLKLISTGEERLIPRPTGLPANSDWWVESWFPDGTRLLAGTGEPGGHESMWTVSMLGQSPRELREGVLCWRISPDGTHIAFSPETSGYLRDIGIMDSEADNPQKVLALGENEWLGSVRWLPDGKRLAYIRGQGTPETHRTSIESCDFKGASPTVIVPDTDLLLRDFCWLPDGRIVYSRQESPDSNDDNLWQITVDGQVNGFFLIKGDSAKLDALVSTTEWTTHITRAALHLEGSGLIRGVAGDEVMSRMALWTSLIPS